MCPGGMIVPAATAPGELVLNGMSPSDRGGRYANSGMVVEIRPGDLPSGKKGDALFAGLTFQEEIEQQCFKMAGNTLFAPAQRLNDFVNGRISANLPASSYVPGLIESPLHQWLPRLIGSALQEGLKLIGRKTKGYLTNEAVVLGVESRTSSPVRIPRDMQTLEHTQIKRLFPCGEGSGYSGGIISSAVDGERVAESLASLYK